MLALKKKDRFRCIRRHVNKKLPRNDAVSILTLGFLFPNASRISSCIASSVVEGYIASIASLSAVTTFAFFSLNFSKIAGTHAFKRIKYSINQEQNDEKYCFVYYPSIWIEFLC